MDVDGAVAQIAERQIGLVAYRQAIALGLSRNQIKNRVEHGVWERVRPRVYRIGGTPRTWTQSVLSAVLSAGDGALASHRTAAQLWHLPIEGGERIEITIPLEGRVRIAGVAAHRSGTLHELDFAEASGVPATSPARTLADLSSQLTVEQLGRALDDGLRRGIVSLSAMHAVARQFGIAPGRSPKKITAVLATRIPGYDPGDSELETRVWAVIRAASLPLPVRRHRVRVGQRMLTIDLAYPEQKIAIEVDGYDPHRSRTAFDVDRIRQNALVVEGGWTVLRFTSRSTDEQIVADVANALFGHSVVSGDTE